ncbi:MAG: hypothetical protein QXD66_02215 [Candidatus Nezhaarchaeales archaeon]|nr:MAG: hypothetical protein DSO05_04155 [Candidatus Nezhaarchaeota archaeon WYZ-LMO7]
MSEISRNRGSRRRLWHYVSGGVFLIGLAVLFYVGFWPWILALLGLIAIIEGIGEYYSREVEKKD